MVHHYMCSNCDVTYYRKTYRYFCTRAVEDMAISDLKEMCTESERVCISDRLLQCNCLIDVDHFNILASDSNKIRRLVKEGMSIKRDKPFLNFFL